jgi:Holliday junction resolvasome RuvABC endonuclease subunit
MLLTLDISATSTGWALFDHSPPAGRDPHTFDYLVQSGSWKMTRQNRVSVLMEEIHYLFDQHEIKSVIIEDAFLGVNAKTFGTLMRLHGIAIAVLAQHGIPPVFIMPSEWRKLLQEGTGYKFNHKGRDVCKQAVLDWLKLLYPNKNISTDDEADAIAIGYSAVLGSQHVGKDPIEAKKVSKSTPVSR